MNRLRAPPVRRTVKVVNPPSKGRLLDRPRQRYARIKTQGPDFHSRARLRRSSVQPLFHEAAGGLDSGWDPGNDVRAIAGGYQRPPNVPGAPDPAPVRRGLSLRARADPHAASSISTRRSHRLRAPPCHLADHFPARSGGADGRVTAGGPLQSARISTGPYQTVNWRSAGRRSSSGGSSVGTRPRRLAG